MKHLVEKLVNKESVTFKPVGNSMVPIINSKDEVTIEPCVPEALEVGDMVLSKVAGSIYLHLISAIDKSKERIQISNNKGRVNGWTSYTKIYGIVTSIAGSPVSSSKDKVIIN